MAVVFANNVIEIAVIQTVSGQPAVNVWHMYHDAEIGGVDKQDIVRDFANNWQDHILSMQQDNVGIAQFNWRSLDPGDGTVGVVFPDVAKDLVGQGTGGACPPNVAFLVKKDTTNRPRGARDGRMFLTGVTESDVDGRGVIAPSAVLAGQALLNAFYNGISDTSLDWSGDSYPVVLETTPASRAPGSASVTINHRRVTSLTLDGLVSTQRDRLR